MADPSLGRMTLALALPLVANHWKIETRESKRSGENLTQVNMQNHLLHHSRLRLSAPRFDFYLPASRRGAKRGPAHAHLGTIQYERASTVCIALPKASERARAGRVTMNSPTAFSFSFMPLAAPYNITSGESATFPHI